MAPAGLRVGLRRRCPAGCRLVTECGHAGWCLGFLSWASCGARGWVYARVCGARGLLGSGAYCTRIRGAGLGSAAVR